MEIPEFRLGREIQNPWDVNMDNVVDIFDLVLVGGQFGQTPPTDTRRDVNDDGTVDIFDLVLVGFFKRQYIHFAFNYHFCSLIR